MGSVLLRFSHHLSSFDFASIFFVFFYLGRQKDNKAWFTIVAVKFSQKSPFREQVNCFINFFFMLASFSDDFVDTFSASILINVFASILSISKHHSHGLWYHL